MSSYAVNKTATHDLYALYGHICPHNSYKSCHCLNAYAAQHTDSRTRFVCTISGYILEEVTALPELRSYPQLHRLQQ